VAETVTATFLNQNGVQIGSVQINLPALGHSSLFLDTVLPASANNLGMVQFQLSMRRSAPGRFALIRWNSRRLIGTPGSHDKWIRIVGNNVQIREPDMVQYGEAAGTVE
jgi:hypothetical protein